MECGAKRQEIGMQVQSSMIVGGEGRFVPKANFYRSPEGKRFVTLPFKGFADGIERQVLVMEDRFSELEMAIEEQQEAGVATIHGMEFNGGLALVENGMRAFEGRIATLKIGEGGGSLMGMLEVEAPEADGSVSRRGIPFYAKGLDAQTLADLGENAKVVLTGYIARTEEEERTPYIEVREADSAAPTPAPATPR
jgi:hypothetical protein